MTIDDFKKLVLDFRRERNWRQFHNPKDLALNLASETGEVVDHFLWRRGQELNKYLKNNKNLVADELADVIHTVLLIAHELDIDLEKAFVDKMKKNEKKYPIQKIKGNNKKASKKV